MFSALLLFQTYKNLILQTSLTLLLTLILTFLKIPVFFLRGLHTYIHPENLGYNNASQSGVRAAIRRPSGSDSNSAAPVLKRRNKSKEKLEFDENNAQIFRLKLDEGHLQTRLLFNEYNHSFVFSFLGISSLALYKYLGSSTEDSGILANGCLIPVVFGLVGLTKIFISLAKVSFEKSASKKSEKHLSLVFGVLGFCLGIAICFGIVTSVLDFDFDPVEGSSRLFVAILMGCLAGFLYIAAGKNARSLWLGTDQLRCNLSMISCGWFGRMILYVCFLLNAFTVLLWINPFAELFVNKNVANSDEAKATVTFGEADKLFGNVGLPRSEFTRFRFLCLLLSGLLQVIALRPNLQMFLNEAVLSWYQRLHASKVPDLDFSRAKVFLHNHYLCLAVLQFFAPSVLVLLLLGLSQIDVSSFDKHQWVCSLLPCSILVGGVPLFMAWWIIFLWALYTSMSLVFYRRGVLYVS